MSLDSGRDVWETIALVRIEWGLSAKTVTASVIIKTTIIILACVSSFVTFLPQTYQQNQIHNSRTGDSHYHPSKWRVCSSFIKDTKFGTLLRSDRKM